MRLLVITNDFPPNPGGIENYIYSLVRRWPAKDVVVVTRRMPGGDEFDAAQEFEILREPVGTLIPKPDLVRRMSALVAGRGIDVVHFPSSLPLGLMGEGLGRPYAVSVHGGEFVLASRIPGARTALKAVCKKAAVLLPESSFAESLVRRLIGPDATVARVTCGVDAERYGSAEPVDIGVDGEPNVRPALANQVSQFTKVGRSGLGVPRETAVGFGVYRFYAATEPLE